MAKWRTLRKLSTFLTAQMSIFMVFCGPLLPLIVQFGCGPGGGGNANKLEGFPSFGCAAAGGRRIQSKNMVFAGGPLLKTIVSYGMLTLDQWTIDRLKAVRRVTIWGLGKAASRFTFYSRKKRYPGFFRDIPFFAWGGLQGGLGEKSLRLLVTKWH